MKKKKGEMMKKRYDVRGMSCAACVAHVEHAAASVCGKENISVSLITNSLTVMVADGTDEKKLYAELKKELKNAGYTLESDEYDDSPKGKKGSKTDKNGKKRSIADEEFRSGIKRLVASAIITVILMAVAMGHMFGIPLC